MIINSVFFLRNTIDYSLPWIQWWFLSKMITYVSEQNIHMDMAGEYYEHV